MAKGGICFDSVMSAYSVQFGTLSVLPLLDKELTRDYFEAFEIEPSLVERETPKLYFLRTENFDSYGAARRIAWHWHFYRPLHKPRNQYR